MNAKTQIFCAGCGIAFVILLTIGWWVIAGFIPAPSPALGANEIAEIYRSNTGMIRFGAMLSMTSMALTIPFIAVIAIQMRRTEGEFPVLTYTQLVAGAATLMPLLLPTLIWNIAAFRPERDPQLTLLLNDFAWIIFIMTFSPFFVQLASIGMAIVSDRHEKPVFARWIGYFNLWVAILFIPGALITFFKTGPFAWNGLLAFWMPLTVFFGWYLVMFFALLKAIRQPSTSH